MSIKIKLLTFISLFALTIGLVVLGVFAATNTQTIKIDGSVDFNVADKTFYVKDVRIKNDNTLSGQGTTIDNFMPGYINSEFKIDLGSVAADTSFTLYFDIINTTDAFYSADEESSVTDATVSASGIIRGDAVNPTNINESTAISGTVELNVTISNPSSVDLNKITILLNEYQEPEIEHSNVLDFTFDNNTVTSYTGSSPDMVIPSSYSIRPSDGAYVEGEDYAVTGIGEFAFANNKVIESATIPESITSLGNYSFANCTNIDEINFNASTVSDLTTNNGVFYNTGKDTTGITVNFADNLSNIPAYLFYPSTSQASSPNIKAVNMADSSLNSIGSYAFAYCNKIATIIISQNVTSIGAYAFYNCTGLTSITIGEGVTSIGDNAFDNCIYLAEINYNATVANDFSSTDYVFRNAGQSGGGITVNIGANVTRLPNYIFGGGSPNIITVNFAEGSVCENIGESTFSNCGSLASVTIPSSVTSIGERAFYYCNSLTSITIPSSVTSIDTNAFSWCSSLTSITIGEGVTSIGNSAFNNCTALTEVNYNATATNDLSSNNYVFRSAGQNGTGITVNIGANVTRLPNYIFYPHNYTSSTNITTVNFAEGSVCENIGESTFAYCSDLTSIIIPDSVTSIGDSAFFGCSSLTSIIIPENVTSISDSVFARCSGLTSITIPETVTSIGESAFSGCSSLTSFTIPENVTSISDSVFRECRSLTLIVIPERVASIGSSAFINCSSLTSINIPDSVTSIGSSAFSGCSSLTSITIPENVTSIGNYAFAYCYGLIEINYNATAANDLSSNNGVFYNAGQSGGGITVNIGASATKLPNYIFYPYSGYSPNITIVNLADGSVCESIGERAFEGCSSLTTVNFGENGQLLSIGNYAFRRCSSLTSITVPDSVTSIGNFAFWECSSLTSITIREGVTSIGDSAFWECSNLTSAIFENPNGWRAGTTSLSADNLRNTSTAARYLRTTYRSDAWTRS